MSWPCGQDRDRKARMPSTARSAPRGGRRGLLVLTAGLMCFYRRSKGRRLRQAPDRASRSRRTCESPVAGEQVAPKSLSECNVGRVVCGYVRSELVSTPHQSKGWIPIDIDGLEVADRGRESALGDRAAQPSLTKHSDGFDINQIGCRDVAGASDLVASSPPVGPIIADCVRENRGVDDDQPRARSSARSSAAWANPTLPPRRRSIRSNTSPTLGLSAKRLSSLARYCCSDCPRCSARC